MTCLLPDLQAVDMLIYKGREELEVRVVGTDTTLCAFAQQASLREVLTCC